MPPSVEVAPNQTSVPGLALGSPLRRPTPLTTLQDMWKVAPRSSTSIVAGLAILYFIDSPVERELLCSKFIVIYFWYWFG